MKASFDGHYSRSEHGLKIVLRPETELEEVLLLTWLRYEANMISANVKRVEAGDGELHVTHIDLIASDAK